MVSIEAAALALALLAASKDATGGAAWDRLACLHYTSRFDQGELVTKRESWVDLSGGRYLTAEQRPGGEALEGFDGKLAWRAGRGMLALEPDQRKARTAAFMKAHGYYFADRWRFEAAPLGTRTVEGRAVDALRLTPEGGSAVELQLDKATHRPFGERYGEFLVVYDDYQEAAGVWLARRARASAPGVAPLAAVTERVAAEAASDSLFSVPAIGWRFEAGASSAAVAARRGAIFEARVNGAGPFPFILDSGGYAQITPELARAAGAADTPNLPVQAELAAGALSISSVTFYVSRGLAILAPRVFGGDKAVGSLGVETLLTLTARLDPEGSIVFSAHDAPAPEGAVAIPLEFENSKPVAAGVLDGVPGRFILDSGSNAEVVLFPAFARRSGLADRLPPGEPAEASYGFFLLPGKKTRARTLRLGGPDPGLGGAAYSDVSVILVGRDIPGAPDVAGLVGMGLLGRAPLTFDYANQRAYIEKKAVSP